MSNYLENPAAFRQQFIDAANRNKSILEFRADPRFASLWTEENIRRSPPLRTEFEHAIVKGTIGEALSMRRGKDAWGKFLRVEPLRPDDILHPQRIVYQLKATNKVRQRWEFRDTFRNVLGKDRRLVTLAMQLKRSEFLLRLNVNDVLTLSKKLDLAPADFWRAVRHGDKYGVDGIHKFMRRLEERTRGYRLEFPESPTGYHATGPTMSTTLSWQCPACEQSNSSHDSGNRLPCAHCTYVWDRTISEEHEHPNEPCIYRGMDLWSCGHIDNA